MTAEGPPPAFDAAIEFFQSHLDEEIDGPDDQTITPRAYFENERGWDAETVDRARLGWAPADADALREHLLDQGYTDEELLATGLFYKDLTPHFQGRYVFPYFDSDRRPVYTISRSAEHPADPKADQKYTKAIKNKDYSAVDEPIYGVDSLQTSGPVLITEGIADAITAHEAGLPCLSPVTTTFKQHHRPELLALLEDNDIDRAYLLQDAERPSIEERDVDCPESISDALNIRQHGEGVRGAVTTATYLVEHGIDARVGELPLQARTNEFHKVDIDDYLTRWDGNLGPVLARAVPPTAHPAYEPPETSDDAVPDQPAVDRFVAGDGETSALFDLNITDVTGRPEGWRGVNPLGHHGDSRNYFKVLDGDRAYDHKYDVTYFPLLFLLCEAGERRDDAHSGSLSDREVFVAWKHAKERGLIPEDDPLPRRALVHVAVARGHCNTAEIEDGWKLPSDAYNAALEDVRDTDGLNPGRDPLSNGGEVVAPLPLEKIEALPTNEQRHAARKRTPSTRTVEDRVQEALFDTFADEHSQVIQAPTGASKTGAAAETHWRDVDDAITGGEPVVLFCGTRNARDEVVDRALDAGLDRDELKVLQGRHELCDMAAGDYDPGGDAVDADDPAEPDPIVIDDQPVREYIDEYCEQRGIPFSQVHPQLERRLERQGREAPCCVGPHKCPSQNQWPSDGFTDADGPKYDLIVATDPFAHVPSLTADTNVIVDELPGFTIDFGLDNSDFSTNGAYQHALTDKIRQAVTWFLGLTEVGPNTYGELLALAKRCAKPEATYWNEHAPPAERPDDSLADEWATTFDALGHEPRDAAYFADRRAHTLAPALARALWTAIAHHGVPGEDRTGEPFDANGRASATATHMPAFDGWDSSKVTIVVDEEDLVQLVRHTPDFATARAVAGLDADPCPWRWQRNVSPDMTIDRVLEQDEERLWRQFERGGDGQTVVQVGEATRPPGKDGQYFAARKATAVTKRLRGYFGDDFRAAGSALAVESELREAMVDAGVPEDEVASMHHGAQRSRNDFADEPVGLVWGCRDPGDDYVMNLLAECGLDARPEMTTCGDCGGAGCPDNSDCHDGQRRAHGREFVGPDDDHAREILASVRDTDVGQMVGRFGRSRQSGHSYVFVVTDAVPERLVDYKVGGPQWVPTALQVAIIEELVEQPSATTREIADAVGCGKEHVRQTLAKLEDRDDVDVTRTRGTGEYGADCWRASPDAITDAASVQLRLDEIANDGVRDHSTWTLAITAMGGVTTAGQAPNTRAEALIRGVDPPRGDDAVAGPPPD